MKYHLNKIICLCWIAVLLIQACGKAELQSTDKFSNEFGIGGRDYTLPCLVYPNGNTIHVSIPAGAVNSTQSLEFYQYKLENHLVLDSFYVNDTAADINLFRCTADTLNQSVLIKLPFYFAATFDTTAGYLPYKVKADDYSDLMIALNTVSNWTAIPDFTYDDSTRHVIFYTDDLNAIYVIAKHK